jgi:hypothetical protein
MHRTLYLVRATALAVGVAAASVGCYAAYEFAAKMDGGYLMVAAPIVAAAAALIPCYFEIAFRDRQWVRGFALLAVWLGCAAVVFYSATERNHDAKAGAEAERSSLRLIADRAQTELTNAKAAKDAATAVANRIRGLEGKACKPITCQSVKATEEAAINRLAAAEKALAAAEAKAVTESGIKQPDWLLPIALDIAGMVLISTGFGLGRQPASPEPTPAKKDPVPTEAPADKKKSPMRVAAGIKAGRTAKLNRAIKAGTVTVLKKR